MTSITANALKSAKSPNREFTVTHDMGGNVDEAVETFGSEYVFMVFAAQQTVKVQSLIRTLMERKLDEGEKWDEGIQQAIDAHVWKVPNAKQTKTEKIGSLWDKMSESEREQFLADKV